MLHVFVVKVLSVWHLCQSFFSLQRLASSLWLICIRLSFLPSNMAATAPSVSAPAVASVPFLDRPPRTFGELVCVHTGNVNAIWVPPSTPMFCQWRSMGGQNAWYYHSGHPSTGPEDWVPLPVQNEEAIMVESFQDV